MVSGTSGVPRQASRVDSPKGAAPLGESGAECNDPLLGGFLEDLALVRLARPHVGVEPVVAQQLRVRAVLG